MLGHGRGVTHFKNSGSTVFGFCVTQTLCLTQNSPLVVVLGCYREHQDLNKNKMLFHSNCYFLIFSLCGHSQAFRKFLPLFDRVLVERLMAETVTKGGIMLPEKSQGKVLQATVVAVGPGSVNQVITYSHPGTTAHFLGKTLRDMGQADIRNVGFHSCFVLETLV